MRFLFVGGCERSGTTLMQRVLCSHSRIAGGPEFLFTWRIAELFDRMRANYPEEFSARLATHYDDAKLRSAFRGFFESFFAEMAGQSPDAIYVAEKTPSNISVAETLLDLFPDARFVHVVRDGRDVVASHREVARRMRSRGRAEHRRLATRATCARWNGAVDAHFRVDADPDLRQRYQLVRYEDLVTEPSRVLADVFSFLNLDFEPACLEPGELPIEESKQVVDGVWTTPESVARDFEPSAVGRWRSRLPLPSRVMANLLMGSNLRRIGYPVGALAAATSTALFRFRKRNPRDL